MDRERLQILISSGPESPERAVLAFSVAAAALSAGTDVLVYLVMNGARWALKSQGNEVDVPGFAPVSALISVVQAAGGTIQVCPNCGGEKQCDLAERQETCEMRPGISRAGLVPVATRMGKTPTLTF